MVLAYNPSHANIGNGIFISYKIKRCPCPPQNILNSYPSLNNSEGEYELKDEDEDGEGEGTADNNNLIEV